MIRGMAKTAIPADKFARALALVRPALEHELSEDDRKKGRVQPPTFERFLVDVEAGFVEGRGHTISARARFGPPAGKERTRSVEVSVKLADLVARWKGDVVAEQEANDIVLRCGKTRATLRGFPPENRSPIAPLGDTAALSVKLAEALDVAADVAKTAVHDESRAVMLAPDRATAFGGQNAILVAIPLAQRVVSAPVYLGVREARALVHWLDELPGGAHVGTSGDWLVAESMNAVPGEGERIAVRCLNGARVPTLADQDHSLKMVPHAHLRQSQLVAVLDRAAAIGADKLWVAVRDGGFWLRGENRVGDEYAEQLDVQWIAGPRVLAKPIAFTPKLLRDALAGFEGYDDVVAFQVGGATEQEDPIAFKLAPAASPTRARVLLARLSD